MKKIVPIRCSWNNIWGSDRYKYGDLYGFSYLPQFRKRYTSDSNTKVISCNSTLKNIHLYTICDSYITNFVTSDTMFCHVSKYVSSRWDYQDNSLVTLDTSVHNILLIEIVERNVRGLTDASIFFNKMSIIKKNQELASNPNNSHDSFNLNIKNLSLFNPLIEQNLEFNLFDYNLFSSIKELKAYINCKFFDRIDPDVALSSNHDYLYLKSTVDTTQNTSSFRPVSNQEIDQIVTVLNQAYTYYKNNGFDEVYFSIAPNPATIIESNRTYNNLIPKIQTHPTLKLPIIDIYNTLKKANYPVYFKSDTHWNFSGFHLFLNDLNQNLEKISCKK